MEDIKKLPKKKSNVELDAPKKLKILITIIDRSRVDYFLVLLKTFHVNLQTVMYARGTAPKEVISYLGIKGKEKAVIFSIAEENVLKEILVKYEDEVFKSKVNQGIALTVPIKSLIGVYIYQFLANIEV